MTLPGKLTGRIVLLFDETSSIRIIDIRAIGRNCPGAHMRKRVEVAVAKRLSRNKTETTRIEARARVANGFEAKQEEGLVSTIVNLRNANWTIHVETGRFE